MPCWTSPQLAHPQTLLSHYRLVLIHGTMLLIHSDFSTSISMPTEYVISSHFFISTSTPFPEISESQPRDTNDVLHSKLLHGDMPDVKPQSFSLIPSISMGKTSLLSLNLELKQRNRLEDKQQKLIVM